MDSHYTFIDFYMHIEVHMYTNIHMLINFGRFMTPKAAYEKMIDLNAEVSAEKIIVALFFEIDSGGIHIVEALMSQDSTAQLQINVLAFKIWYIRTIVFLMVLWLIDIITKEQEP